ncbi:putative cyclophilin [Mycena leptocephala]|nr:putative cyclophilin [Mycena leptocephala]
MNSYTSPCPPRLVLFDISINYSPAGCIIFKLCDDVTPKTRDNFRKLCQKLDINGAQSQDGCYAGSKFHRIIPSSCSRAATSPATTAPAGAPSTARNENFQLKHTKPGLLLMANAGPNTNGSQSLITTVVTSWLDGKHVVLFLGMDLGSSSGTPSKTVAISAAGVC